MPAKKAPAPKFERGERVKADGKNATVRVKTHNVATGEFSYWVEVDGEEGQRRFKEEELQGFEGPQSTDG